MTAGRTCSQGAEALGGCLPAEVNHVPTAKRQDEIVKTLRLTPVQRKTLTWIRERQFIKLAVIADARRELNMKVR